MTGPGARSAAASLSPRPAFAAALRATLARTLVHESTVAEVRVFILSLPGMTEGQHHGTPDFRLGGKIKVNLEEDDGTITIKLPIEEQAALIDRGGHAFSLPGGPNTGGPPSISLRRTPSRSRSSSSTHGTAPQAPTNTARIRGASRRSTPTPTAPPPVTA